MALFNPFFPSIPPISPVISVICLVLMAFELLNCWIEEVGDIIMLGISWSSANSFCPELLNSSSMLWWLLNWVTLPKFVGVGTIVFAIMPIPIIGMALVIFCI